MSTEDKLTFGEGDLISNTFEAWEYTLATSVATYVQRGTLFYVVNVEYDELKYATVTMIECDLRSRLIKSIHVKEYWRCLYEKVN